jgi:hypothetical protein
VAFTLVQSVCLARASELADSPGIRPTSHFRRVAIRPSIDIPAGVHSHSRLSAAASALRMPSEALVSSSWFRTTSTTSSYPPGSGLLHPDTDPGVPRVSGYSAFPATWIRTPRRIFLVRSRIASPRPFPPCRFNDFEALLSERVRGFDVLLPTHRNSVLPGLCSSSRSFEAFAFPVAKDSVLPTPPKRCVRQPSSVPHPTYEPKFLGGYRTEALQDIAAFSRGEP